MAAKTILPTTNLTFDDIRDTLNNFGGSVTNVVATAFSSTAKINRWSRNKPESYKADFIAGGGSPKALNNFGLTIPVTSGTGLFDSKVWVYTLPSGGVNSPYRLGDFCGYFVYAGAPVGSSSPSAMKDTGSRSGKNYTYGFVMLFNNANSMYNSDPNTYIGIQELKGAGTVNASGLYPGMAIRYRKTASDSWNYFWVTSYDAIGSSPTSIPVVLKMEQVPWSLSSGTMLVEVAYGLFGTRSSTSYDTTTRTCNVNSTISQASTVMSVETTSGANKKSYTVTYSKVIKELTYTITASYTVSGSTVTINSFSVKMVTNDEFKQVKPSVYLRPYVVIAYGSTNTQKYISSTVKSVTDWSGEGTLTKTLSWSSSELNSRTFSGLSSIKSITFIAAGADNLSAIQNATNIDGDLSLKQYASTQITNGTYTVTG